MDARVTVVYYAIILFPPRPSPPPHPQAPLDMMEQEKRRMELEVSRMLLHKQKTDRLVNELQFLLKEEKRKRKRERKTRKVRIRKNRVYSAIAIVTIDFMSSP